MSTADKLTLGDFVHAEQSNLLASVLALSRMGASMPQIDVAIDILLVIFTGMKATGRSRPVVSEDLKERALRRIAGSMRFTEGMTPAQMDAAVRRFIDERPEPRRH